MIALYPNADGWQTPILTSRAALDDLARFIPGAEVIEGGGAFSMRIRLIPVSTPTAQSADGEGGASTPTNLT